MPEQRVFDAEREITIKSKRLGRQCRVRFPSDGEWIERNRSIRMVRKNLGPNHAETELENVEKADLALFQAIRLDQDGSDFDDDAASTVMDVLSRREAGAAVSNESVSEVRVPLTVLGGVETEHVLGMPSERELRRYRRAAYGIIQRKHGDQETKINLAAIGSFYDGLVKETTGYSGAVPVIHKLPVIEALEVLIDQLDDEAEVDF